MPFELQSTLGYNGNVHNGLHLDALSTLYYPLGHFVVRLDEAEGRTFLEGHNGPVSALALSESGRYVASGTDLIKQKNAAEVIVWDTEESMPLFTSAVHKNRVISLSFSATEQYVVSLEENESSSLLVLYDLRRAKTVASTFTKAKTNVVLFTRCDDRKFVTVGEHNMKMWTITATQNGENVDVKLSNEDFRFGSFRRVMTCAAIDGKDARVYAGSTTGDVVVCDLKSLAFVQNGPLTRKGVPMLGNGVSAIAHSPTGLILAGTGSGELVSLESASLNLIRRIQIHSQPTTSTKSSSHTHSHERITSISVREDGDILYCGTAEGNIDKIDVATLKPTPIATSHKNRVNSLVFAGDCSRLVLSCAHNTVRVWHSLDGKELLRITNSERDRTLIGDTTAQDEGNVECMCVNVPKNGKCILSGWADGSVIAHTPESGKVMWTQQNIHYGGVRSLCVNPTGVKVLTGGNDGVIKVWRVETHSRSQGQSQIPTYTQTLEKTLKEHSRAIVSLQLSLDEREAMSASEDGTCIVWDLSSGTRKAIIHSQSTNFGACYHPEEGQIVTVSQDRKLCYWDAFTGALLRAIEMPSVQTCVAVSADGEHVLCGGDDGYVRLYGYDSGEPEGMSGRQGSAVRSLACSPDGSFVVAGGLNGDIFFWNY